MAPRKQTITTIRIPEKPSVSLIWKRVGKNIQRLLDLKGMNQSQFARRLNWQASYVNRIVSGNKPVSVERLKEISDALGADIFELFYPR